MSVSVQLVAKGDGRCAVAGPLTLETATVLWQLLKTGGCLRNVREADLSAVTESDSAGLALLVTWRGHCLAAGGGLSFRGIPQRILALARITDAEAALGA